MDAERPEVLDLEGELLDLLSDQLRGSAGLFADGSPVHYREALRGERHLHLADLCRLARSRRPEAQRALAAVLGRLQAQLEETAGVSVDDLHELIAGFAQQTADVTAAGTRALKDGRVDEDEDRRLAREIGEAEVSIALLKEGLAQHRQARQKGGRA